MAAWGNCQGERCVALPRNERATLFKHLLDVGGKFLALVGGEDVGDVRDYGRDVARAFFGDLHMLRPKGLEPRSIDRRRAQDGESLGAQRLVLVAKALVI